MVRSRCALLLLLLVPLSTRAGEPVASDVFVPKVDGFASIRIPSVVVSKKGTVLAFAEGRAADADQAKNRILLKRSTDGGKTWDRVAVIAEDGNKALNNPCVVVEQQSGRILLLYQSYPAGISERSGKIQPGYEGEMVVRNWLLTSDDDGLTWSMPQDVTRQTKREKDVTTVAGGPGLGIQLRHGKHAGRILFPLNEGPFGLWNIYAIYSDDQGKTWQMGEPAPGALIDAGAGKKASTVNEAQFVELNDGSIRFNVRRWAGKAVRKTCVSTDGGVTWSKIEDVPDLVDPGCMASVLRYSDPSDGRKSRLLYSGPQSTKRDTGTVCLSYDEGKTWPVRRVLCKEAFAYSCLTALPGGTIGCLYEAEGTSKIVFARFTLDWLTEGKDRHESVLLDLATTGTDERQIDHSKLPILKGTHAVINPADAELKFQLHNYLIHHDGKFWCMWSQGPPIEDEPTQQIRYATSVDGLKWSEARVLTKPAKDSHGTIARGFWLRDGELLALVAHFKGKGAFGADKELKLEAHAWDAKASAWVYKGIVYENAINNFPPQKLPSGEWMMTRRDARFNVSVLIGGLKAFDDWKMEPVVERLKIKGFNPDEPIWYPLADKRLLALFRDNGGSSRLFRAFSTDLGRTWSSPILTNFPNATSKIFSLQTSAGDRVLISNANPALGRRQLHLSISADGLTYRNMALIDIPSPRPGTLQYPHAIEHDNHLYIAFSRNKAQSEIIKIPLSEIAALRSEKIRSENPKE